VSAAWVGALARLAAPIARAFLWVRDLGRNDRANALSGAELLLERAEIMALQGGWEEGGEMARAAARSVERRRDPAALRVATRALQLVAECEAGLGRGEPGRAALQLARALRASLAGAEAGGDLLARERLLAASPALAEPGSAAGAAADALLESAEAGPVAPSPAHLVRLARLAIERAGIQQQEGSWPGARRRLELAVRLGERVPAQAPPALLGEARDRALLVGALARSRASWAASEIGQVLVSMGRHAEAAEWLDRAVATLEGAQLPPADHARARALIVRAMGEPPDADPGAEARVRWLRRALDCVAGGDWPAARALAARAEIQLGVLLASQNGEAASERFRAAVGRLDGLAIPGVAELAAEARLLLGHVLEDQGRLDDARAEYRGALDAGREDADPDARRLAAVAGCHLHRLLHHADRADEGAVLLETLEALTPTLAPEARPLLAAMVARCRGQQQFRAGDRAAADGTLQQAWKLVEPVDGPEARDLMRQIAAERGHLALAGDDALAAEGHFRRGLAVGPGSRPPAVDQAERAELHLRVAQCLLRLERFPEARAELERAFSGGRDSGRSSGRAVAGAAALLLGDDEDAPLGERRRWYETAARFGRLSGTPRGRQVEEAVAERLRELKG